MLEFMKLIKEIHPGIFVHSIFINEDPSEDRKAGFVRQKRLMAGMVELLILGRLLVWKPSQSAGICGGPASFYT